jgi:hypothetical protein
MVRGSAVTTWTHIATAPIQGRAPAALPVIGSTVGAEGAIMELVNDRLDPAPVLMAEAALANARLRVTAAREFLDQVRALDDQRRELMKRHAADYRAELDAEIAVREARIALLAATKRVTLGPVRSAAPPMSISLVPVSGRYCWPGWGYGEHN